jgi:hypothetical protein
LVAVAVVAHALNPLGLIPDNVWQKLTTIGTVRAAAATIIAVWVLVARHAGWMAWKWFKRL